MKTKKKLMKLHELAVSGSKTIKITIPRKLLLVFCTKSVRYR